MIDVNTLVNLSVWIILLLLLSLLIGIGFFVNKITNYKIAIVYAVTMFLFILIFSICFCKNCKKELYKPNDPVLHEKLYNLMEYFDKLSQEHDIKYWAIAGTALGMTRNKGIIPHDDDLDVGMLEEDLDKLMSLSEKFKKDGYILNKNSSNVLKFSQIKYLNNSEHIFSVWIDIFILKKENDNDNQIIIKYKDEKHQELWPTEWFYEKELFPLRRYHFGKIKINGPKKPKKYLDRAYPGWKKIRLDFPHTNITCKKILMLIYNRLGLFP